MDTLCSTAIRAELSPSALHRCGDSCPSSCSNITLQEAVKPRLVTPLPLTDQGGQPYADERSIKIELRKSSFPDSHDFISISSSPSATSAYSTVDEAVSDLLSREKQQLENAGMMPCVAAQTHFYDPEDAPNCEKAEEALASTLGSPIAVKSAYNTQQSQRFSESTSPHVRLHLRSAGSQCAHVSSHRTSDSAETCYCGCRPTRGCSATTLSKVSLSFPEICGNDNLGESTEPSVSSRAVTDFFTDEAGGLEKIPAPAFQERKLGHKRTTREGISALSPNESSDIVEGGHISVCRNPREVGEFVQEGVLAGDQYADGRRYSSIHEPAAEGYKLVSSRPSEPNSPSATVCRGTHDGENVVVPEQVVQTPHTKRTSVSKPWRRAGFVAHGAIRTPDSSDVFSSSSRRSRSGQQPSAGDDSGMHSSHSVSLLGTFNQHRNGMDYREGTESFSDTSFGGIRGAVVHMSPSEVPFTPLDATVNFEKVRREEERVMGRHKTWEGSFHEAYEPIREFLRRHHELLATPPLVELPPLMPSLRSASRTDDTCASVQHIMLNQYQGFQRLVGLLPYLHPDHLSRTPRCCASTEAQLSAVDPLTCMNTHSARYCVLLYAIPSFKRCGGRNRKWKECNVHFYVDRRNGFTPAGMEASARHEAKPQSQPGAPYGWHMQRLVFLFEDRCNNDSVFITCLPCGDRSRAKYCFFTDAESEDADFPDQATVGSGERSPAGNVHYSAEWPNGDAHPLKRFQGRKCYDLPTTATIVTVRDGELAEGDRIFRLGVCLRLDGILRQAQEWKGASLLYMLENAGKWVEKSFSDIDATVVLSEHRSVTFVVKSKDGQRYLHGAEGGNMRVAFPGLYMITWKGHVVECPPIQVKLTVGYHDSECLIKQLLARMDDVCGSELCHRVPYILCATTKSDNFQLGDVVFPVFTAKYARPCVHNACVRESVCSIDFSN